MRVNRPKTYSWQSQAQFRDHKGHAGDLQLAGHLVSVRKAKETTVNQVRAVRYQPLVVFDSSMSKWYVVPPHEVVRLVSAKLRGQHCANTYESQTLSLRDLDDYQLLDWNSLRDCTLAAVEAGETHSNIRDAMSSVRREVEALAARSIELIRPWL